MKKSVIFLLACTLLLGFSGIGLTAEDYDISDWSFIVSTRTYEGGDPITYVWFTIVDKNDYGDYGVQAMDYVVESATITAPNGVRHDFIPEEIRHDLWSHLEWSGDDNNRNGIIEFDQGEYEPKFMGGLEYEIILPESPHIAGTYTLDVVCTNGQNISKSVTVSDGLNAVELPPVTNLAASFNQDGRFQVSWTLPETPYPDDARLQIRVDVFLEDGNYRYFRIKHGKLPATLSSDTFLKFESDLLRNHVPYINVKVRTHWGDNVATSVVKEYAIEGYNVIPTTIPTPIILSPEQLDEMIDQAIIDACPGNSENFPGQPESPGRPESPGNSNPPGQEKK